MGKYNSIKQNVVFTFISLFGLLLPSHSFAWNRIVTLNPMASEWVAGILGPNQAAQKIVGVSEYSNFPEYLKKIKTIGPYPNIQFESILALKPDLVIGSAEYNRDDQLQKLKELKLNVIVLPKENLFKMSDWIGQLGKVLNEPEATKLAIAEWQSDLSKIKTLKKNKKVFFQIQFQPLITIGSESFLNDAFNLVGFENIFQNIKQSYPKVSKEAVFEKNPDVVLVFEMVKNQEDLNKIKLTWKKSVIQVLNGDDFSRCSPRLLKALKEMK